MRITLLIVISIFSLHCSKIEYFEDNTINAIKVKIAHRSRPNLTYKDNTLEGAIECLKYNDGIEVDIQISKDETIWLSHNYKVESCNGDGSCFSTLSDQEITNLDSCSSKKVYYNTLESVLKYMSENWPKKYIIIDLKGWEPCSGGQLDVDGMMRLEARKVVELAIKYNMEKQVIMETNSLTVLEYTRKKSELMPIYLVAFGDLERGMLFAMKYNLTGVSLKTNMKEEPNSEYCNLFHKKGKRLMVWNLQSAADTTHYFNLGVDIIQYDMY